MANIFFQMEVSTRVCGARGMMSGRGVFTWPDNSVYDGEWKDGKRYVLMCLVVHVNEYSSAK